MVGIYDELLHSASNAACACSRSDISLSEQLATEKIAKERSAEEDFADDQEVLAKLLSPSREDGEKQGSNDRSGSKSKNTGQESPALARELSGGKRGSAEMNQGGHEDAKQSVKRRPSVSTRPGSVANTQARGSGNVANTQALPVRFQALALGP